MPKVPQFALLINTLTLISIATVACSDAQSAAPAGTAGVPSAPTAGGATAGSAGAPSGGAPNGNAGASSAGSSFGEAGSGGGGGGAGNGGGGATNGGGGAANGGAQPLGGTGSGEKFLGNITTRNQVRDDFLEYWDQITPENEGKWGLVERERDTMTWAGLDRVYAFAREHQIPVKGHTLVWGSQQPGWVAGLPQAEQREEVEEWIRLYCERYPDTRFIDVVNEPPPHTRPAYMAALGGEGASGHDWIVQSFKWARQYCPSSILILNDYNNIEYEADNTRIIDIVKRIQQAGAPIDAIGAQAHDAYKLSAATLEMYIDELASSTGLPVYISEYDIDVASDEEQLAIMQSQFAMFWSNPNVKGVTLWGYVVGQTWRRNTGLVTAQGQPRPALTWLMGFVQR